MNSIIFETSNSRKAQKKEVMSAKELIEITANKGYSVSRYKPGVYQYSTNGYEWTRVNCKWNEFVKILKALPSVK